MGGKVQILHIIEIWVVDSQPFWRPIDVTIQKFDERSMYLALYWWSYIYIMQEDINLTLEIDMCDCTQLVVLLCAFLCI